MDGSVPGVLSGVFFVEVEFMVSEEVSDNIFLQDTRYIILSPGVFWLFKYCISYSCTGSRAGHGDGIHPPVMLMSGTQVYEPA